MVNGECFAARDVNLITEIFAKVNVDLAKSIEDRLAELNKGK